MDPEIAHKPCVSIYFLRGDGLLFPSYSQRCVQSLEIEFTYWIHFHSNPNFSGAKTSPERLWGQISTWTQTSLISDLLLDPLGYSVFPLTALGRTERSSHLCLGMECGCCFEQKVHTLWQSPETSGHPACGAVAPGQHASIGFLKGHGEGQGRSAVPVYPQRPGPVPGCRRNSLTPEWLFEGGLSLLSSQSWL